jgi:hypothetical protein
VLRSALDRAWQELGCGAASVDVSDFAKACAASMPDMDDVYGGLDRRGANAADALAFLMEALMGSAVAGVAEMAVLAHHNAELLAQDLEGIGNFRELDYGQRILAHPTVQAELRRQHEDLEFLAAWGSGLQAALPILESRWRGDDRLVTYDGDTGEGGREFTAAREALLERAGGWLSLTEAASAVGKTWQWLYHKLQVGSALGMMRDGEMVMPKLQFVEEASERNLILPGVDKVVRLFRLASAGPWSVLQFLVDIDPNLGRAPIDVLRSRDANAVEHAAKVHLGMGEE